jgi:hypothetical protein
VWKEKIVGTLTGYSHHWLLSEGAGMLAWQMTKPVGEMQGLEDALQRARQGIDRDDRRQDPQEQVHSELHVVLRTVDLSERLVHR